MEVQQISIKIKNTQEPEIYASRNLLENYDSSSDKDYALKTFFKQKINYLRHQWKYKERVQYKFRKWKKYKKWKVKKYRYGVSQTISFVIWIVRNRRDRVHWYWKLKEPSR